MGDPQPLSTDDNAVIALIAVGSNLGTAELTPLETVRAALRELARAAEAEPRISYFYANPAYPPGSGPDFVNAAAALRWNGSAPDLLALLHRIEAGLGRIRRERWAPRSVDLDLLALGDEVAPDAQTQAGWAALTPGEAAQKAPEGLILPHPRLAERAFVLVPLADVAPDWRHPITGRSVTEMLDALPGPARAEMRRL